jgi:hypothetical protein
MVRKQSEFNKFKKRSQEVYDRAIKAGAISKGDKQAQDVILKGIWKGITQKKVQGV